MKKVIILYVVIFTIGAVAFFFGLNNYIYREKQAPENPVITPFQGALSGEYVCLPHKDGEEPATCEAGLKTDVGEYYVLDLSAVTFPADTLEIGKRVSASGRITPIETLSTDHWKKYDVASVFTVTEGFEILE